MEKQEPLNPAQVAATVAQIVRDMRDMRKNLSHVLAKRIQSEMLDMAMTLTNDVHRPLMDAWKRETYAAGKDGESPRVEDTPEEGEADATRMFLTYEEVLPHIGRPVTIKIQPVRNTQHTCVTVLGAWHTVSPEGEKFAICGRTPEDMFWLARFLDTGKPVGFDPTDPRNQK